jgi:Putative binding domain, N-terminal
MARGWLRVAVLTTLLTAAAVLPACTSAQTSTALTTPTTGKCQFQVTGSPSSFPASGGQGTLSIETTRECDWSATSSADWVSVPNSSGQGGASVSYSVAENSVPSPRSASIAVEGQTVQLRQEAAPCRYALSHDTDQIGSAGGRVSVGLEAPSGCGWTAAADAAWLTIAGDGSGSGSATITLAASANTGAVRVVHVNIAGQIDVVTQDAAPESSTGPPPPPPPPGETTQVAGPIDTLLPGVCPDLPFLVKGRVIVATSSTEYTRKSSCGDLAPGVNVTVTGTVQLDVSILASKIDVRDKRHGD